MIRMTVHLNNVKPILVEGTTHNKESGKKEYYKKKKLYNTVTFNCESEDEGLLLMNNLMDKHKSKKTGVKVGSYYFTNLV